MLGLKRPQPISLLFLSLMIFQNELESSRKTDS